MIWDPILEYLSRLADFGPVIVLPIIVLGIWMALFFNGSPAFTQIIINFFFLILGIPLLVIIGLSVFVLAFSLALQQDQELAMLFGQSLVVAFFFFTFVLQYIFVSRLITRIEEKEGMGILKVIKREFNPEYRRKIRQMKEKRVAENRDFFDQIADLNVRKREEEKAAKERLRAVLLRGDDSNTSSNNEGSTEQ